MKERIYIILAAAFGGILSNIIDIAIRLQKQPPNLPVWTYWIGCFIWALCGAGVALVWGEKNLRKAFYLGIGLPALIQANLSNPMMHQTSDRAQLELFIRPAIAQQTTNPILGRVVSVIRNKDAPADQWYSVIFSSADGAREEKTPIQFERMPVPVPSYATKMVIQYQQYRSPVVPLPTQNNVSLIVEVVVTERKWSGFLQSIGRRDTPKYEVEVKVEKPRN